jgi:Rho guanine nucleotide exchange factor 17
VRFLTAVEIDGSIASKRILKNYDIPNSDANSKLVLVISGGDGFEDFRTNGTNTMNEGAGREDSTNHLLMWQHVL